MSQAIANVSDSVTLIAILAAAWAAGLYCKTLRQERLVQSFASKDRQKAIAVLRAYVPAEAVGLAPEQQFLMARAQIRGRAERWRQGAIAFVAIVLVAAAVSLANDKLG
jgi:hypothetical protein